VAMTTTTATDYYQLLGVPPVSGRSR